MSDDDQGLFKKLQIKPGMRIAVLHAPAEYEARLESIPAGVACVGQATGEFDLIHLFATEKQAVLAEAPGLAKALKAKGILWISYPKGKQLSTDLNRDILRESLVAYGFEAVSIVAVDDRWSALRFKRL